MKTSIYSIIAAGCFLSLTLSCNKISKEPVPQAEQITVTASLPDATKVAAGDTDSGTGLSWSWEEGDKITVVGSTPSVLDIQEGFTAKKASFKGNPVSGGSYSIIYPGTFTSTSELEQMALSEQSQKDVSSKAHLKYFALLQGLKAFDTFEFSPAWAQANGAELKLGGVLKMVLALPSETVLVNKITVKASSPVFHADNAETMTDALSLSLEEGTLPDNKTVTAWMTTSWHDTPIPAGTQLNFTVAAGDFTWMRSITIDAEKTIKAGSVNTLTLDAAGWGDAGRYSGGTGTEADPWLISSAKQMLYINEDLKGGELRCFKLTADIDMSGIEGWTPLNYASPYDRKIDFDGGGHTISGFKCDYPSYASFFGVLYGKCHDVTFTGAVIEGTTNSSCAILGGYGGTGDLRAEVYNVHVQGTVTFTGNKTGVGGMFGQLANASVKASSADVKVESGKNYVGGLCGYVGGSNVQIEDCWTKGSVSGNQRVGGITGGITKDNAVVRNCYSLCSVAANFAIGGIAGHCNQDKGDQMDTRMPGNVFEKCIAWNDFIKANTVTPGDKSHYSGGAIVGFTASHNILTDCMRKPDLEFQDYSDLFGLYDQENASVDVPLVVNPVEGATYNYPYHGKAAAAGSTPSQVAQSLGWSADIWDFSGETPQFKK